jgi:Flp pilus assembly protein TadD
MVAKLVHIYYPALDQRGRRVAMLTFRLALMLDPESADANNNLAWALISVPSDPWFDSTRGLALAQKAVALQPSKWLFLNTLGVAAYRTRDWNAAAELLQKSITFTGGDAHDLFFLAMTYWQQGNKKEARTFYDRAVAWADKNESKDPELERFRAEAAALLGQPCNKPNPEKQQNCEKKRIITETAHR